MKTIRYLFQRGFAWLIFGPFILYEKARMKLAFRKLKKRWPEMTIAEHTPNDELLNEDIKAVVIIKRHGWYSDSVGKWFFVREFGNSYVVNDDYKLGSDALWRHIEKDHCRLFGQNSKESERQGGGYLVPWPHVERVRASLIKQGIENPNVTGY